MSEKSHVGRFKTIGLFSDTSLIFLLSWTPPSQREKIGDYRPLSGGEINSFIYLTLESLKKFI